MVGAGVPVPVPVPGHTVRPTKKLDSGSLVQTGRQWRQEKGQQNNLGHTRKTPVIDFFLQKGERRRYISGTKCRDLKRMIQEKYELDYFIFHQVGY